ncbi:UbiA prenyltransferase family-domain-containing protein [Earliella scabrosa]|nr:UbiA prenyltransferase family-domain-containing protein [Earliella scabrosa]
MSLFAHLPTDLLLAGHDDPFSRIHFTPILATGYALSIYRTILEHLYTLYLFTRSDLKTILLPTLVYGTAAAPASLPIPQLLPRMLWIWVHLLQFCMSNQCVGLQEDAANKPWRPIPSRRITVAAARHLRWALLAVCLVLSARSGVLLASAGLAFATLAYNELRLDSHWASRHVCNALGYAAFNAGATYVGCSGAQCVPETTISAAQIINALVVLTTIHAPDFEDAAGDRLDGRLTLPVAFPRGSRFVMAAMLLGWSAFLVRYWATGTVCTTVLLGLGTLAGVRFLLFDDAKADHTSFRLYTAWLCTVQIVPFLVGS